MLDHVHRLDLGRPGDGDRLLGHHFHHRNLARITRPDGRQIHSEYNEAGLATSVVGPDGARWRQTYDDAGNVVSVSDPTGATTSYASDEHGHRASVTDALGQTRHIKSDAAGLAVAVTDALGATTRYERNDFGRIVSDPLGGVTTMAWTRERAGSALPARWHHQSWTYDGEGNLVEHLDALGQATSTEYTHFALPAAEVGPDGARLEFSYDTELRLVAVTNPQGLVWRYA